MKELNILENAIERGVQKGIYKMQEVVLIAEALDAVRAKLKPAAEVLHENKNQKL